MKTHLPVALRKALIAALFSVSAFAYNKAYAEVSSPDSALEVTVGGNNETHEYDGDIMVSPMDSASGYDGLNLHAGNGADDTPGNITMESTATTLYNPEIVAEGNITIGVDSEGNVNEHQNLIIRGSGSSVIEAGGDIVFNHRVDAAVGQDASSGNGASTDATYTGTLSINADGDITFDSIGVQRTNVSTIRLAGGITENDMATMSAGGNITVKDAGSSELAWTRYSKVSAGGDIDVQLPFGNGIFSGVVDAEGNFSFGGANFTAMDPKDTTPSITAGTGISVYTSSLNTVSSAELLAEQGDIELISYGGGYSNYIYQAKATANDGDVRIESSNGRAYMISSVVDSDTGNVGMTGARVDAVQSSFTAAKNLTLAGTSNTGLADVTATADTISVGTETGDTNITSESELENVHSSLTATGDIDVKGSRVNISDDATIRSHDGSVSIKAYGEYEEGPVTHNPMGGVNIREAEVEAQGDISITGAAVVMTDASAVSVGGAVPVTGETDFVSGADTTPPGTVSIGGSVETTLKGVEVDGGSLAIGNASGATTLGSSANDGSGTTPTTLDATGRIVVTGTTVSLTDVSVDSTGADADGVSVSIAGGNVEVSGENVTGTGAVNIAGTTSTTVNGVDVDGASISVGADGTTSISNGTALDSAGDIAVKGDSVGITGSTVDSTQGNVSVIADNGDASIAGGSIQADGNVQITATEATDMDATITATNGSVTVTAGTDNTIDSALAAGTDVSVTAGGSNALSSTVQGGNSVAITATAGSNSLTGASVTATDGSVAVTAGTDNTIDSALAAGTDVTVTAGGSNALSSTVQGGDSVAITATTGSNELKDAVTATGGSVTVAAGTDNTISAEVQGKTEVSITATQGENSLTGASVTATDGSVAVTAGTDNSIDSALAAGTDVTVTAGGSNALSSTVQGGDSVAITATAGSNSLTGASVTADEGSLTVTAGTDNSIDSALAAGTDVIVTAGDSNVLSSTAQGGNSVAITATTGSNELKDAVTATGGSVTVAAGTDNTISAEVQGKTEVSITATQGENSLTGASVTATDGSVAVTAGTDNTIDSALTAGTDVTVTAGGSNVLSSTVQGGDSVAITATAGSNSLTGASVTVDEGSLAVTSGTDNTIDSALAAGTDVIVTAGGSNVLSSTVQGGNSVAITATTGSNELKDAVTATGGSVTVAAGTDNTISAEVQGKTEVSITATQGENSLTGASVTATDGSVAVTADTDNTIDSALAAGTDVSVTAGGSNVLSSTVQGGDSVAITASAGSNSLTGASVTADEGSLTVTAGTDNTIDSALAAGTDVSVTAGGSNVLSSTVQGGDSVAITATSGSNSLTGASVTADEGSLTVTAGTDNTIDSALTAGTDVSVTAGGSNTLSSAVSAGEEVAITAGGINSIAADVSAGNGSVTFTGGTANVVGGSETDVSAANGAVQLNGGINLVDGAALIAQAPAEGELNENAGQVIISGDSNVLRNSAEIQSDAGVTMVATGQDEQAGNLISASTVQSDGGNIAINADNINRITDSSVQAAAGNVSLDSGVANIVEGSTTEVSATDGSIELKGSAAVTNLVDGAELNASGDASAVTVTGASNVIRNGATVQGEAGVTINSAGTGAAAGNVISGSAVASGCGDVAISAANINLVDDSTLGAAAGSVTLDAESNLVRNGSEVEAGAGISITSTGEGEYSGNQVSGSSLQATGGFIALTAKKSNHVTAGADIAADAGAVTLSGEVNVVDSASTITGQDTVAISGSSSNSIAGASAVKSTAGNVLIDGGETAENSISGTDTLVSAEAEVDIDGKTNVISDGAAVESGDMLSLDGADYNVVSGGASLVGGTGIEISSASAAEDHGNLVEASSLTATTGDIAITAARTNKLASGAVVTAEAGNVSLSGGLANIVEGSTTEVNATDGSIELKGGAAVTNLVDGAGLNASGDESAVSITGVSNVVRNDATVQGEDGVTISSTGTDTAAGNVISGSAVSSGAGDVAISAANINLVDDSELGASTGTVTLEGESNLVRNGSDVEAGAGITITSTGDGEYSGNLVSDSALTAGTGDVALVSEVHNHVTDAAVLESESGKVSLTGDRNIIMGGSSVLADSDVAMTANELNAVNNSELNSEKGDVIIGDEGGSTETVTNAIVSTDGQMVHIVAGQNVRVAGKNVISGENFGDVNLIAGQGDITLSDDNEITHAVMEALGTEGDVAITTGTGNKGTTITNTGIYGQTVTIAGDITDRSDANLAVVTGEDTCIISHGAKDGVGLTLNNVSVLDTQKGAGAIRARNQGDIVILNRVDVENGTLTIDDGATSSGRIVVDAGNVLNARSESSLDGCLAGAGDINKSGGDSLLLNYDHTGFTGSIYANGALGGGDGSVVEEDNAGSWIEISDAGVGAEASIVLKNTDLVISTDKTQIGTLDTTQDSDANAAGTASTLLADGSYTADDNTRQDFTMIGSVLEVNKGAAGDVVQASDMKLSDATLIKLDAEVGADGQAHSDVIKVAGSIDVAAARTGNGVSPATAPVTARVFVTHLGDTASANEGTRTTIMEGTIASDVNEDVLYDVERSANGTYQRVLQERNVHLENKGDHVDLVYSRNYRSASKDAQLTAVANVLQQISDNFHHSEGTLAASGDTMERLIDAFDYTRSEDAAVRGLRSVGGFGNVLPRLMQFDSSRHHLSNLRRQMALPVCPRTQKGAENRAWNTWITYTGAQDELNGYANMGDYSRTGNGFLLGVDRSLTCNLRVGASMGYESASSSSDAAKVDGDTFFLDAYAVAVKGKLRHRASVGLAASSFDMKRGVAVEAGYHSFSGQTKGSVDGLTLNFGYELSSDYQLNERSYLTRYLTVNLSWHQLDSMKDRGLGNVGLETSYDDDWQADVAIGLQYNREFSAVRHEAPATFYATAELHLDLLNEQVSAHNRFSGSSAGWEVKSMKRDRFYAEFGAGVIVPLSPAWTATAGAAVEVGAEHTSFSGHAGVRYSF